MRGSVGPTHSGHGEAEVRIRWQPPDFTLREAAEAVVRDSIRELGLEGVVREVNVHVDLMNRDDHAYIEWNTHDHRSARLSFALGNFVTAARRRAWRRTWGRRPGPPPVETRHFSRRSFAEACLHELLHLKDDHESGVDLAGHPEADRDALNELWNVWIDGRLHRRGLPAMSRAERHRVYVRTLDRYPRFRRRGERIFNALWVADHLGPKELRAFLSELEVPAGRRGPGRRGSVRRRAG